MFIRMIPTLFIGLFCSALYGQSEAPEKIEVPLHYIACRPVGKIAIDGKLDEPSWQRAEWTEYFVDIEGDGSPLPRFKTRAKMLWDDTYFYVAADMEEPHVWATLTARDTTIYHDNDFEVYIDPDGDTHEYYEFEINAFGAESDLLLLKPYRDGGLSVNSWNIKGLKSAVQVWGSIGNPLDTDAGWSVELAFPWAVLKECANRPTPPRDGDHWRVNFSRLQWEVEIDQESYIKVEGASVDNWVWSPQNVVNIHYPERWGFVQFSTGGVGQSEAAFQLPPEEEAKKVLRSIYHQQRQFRERHGHYTTSLDSLGLEYQIMQDFLWPPRLQVTDHLFEASFEEVVDLHQDGRISHWFIRQDSKTWKD
jgi:hypothetical protein